MTPTPAAMRAVEALQSNGYICTGRSIRAHEREDVAQIIDAAMEQTGVPTVPGKASEDTICPMCWLGQALLGSASRWDDRRLVPCAAHRGTVSMRL